MARLPARRRFLGTVGAGAALGLRDLTELLALSPMPADEGKATPDKLRFGPDLEPLVRLIEETPREKCVAALAEQLRAGLPYRRFLSAIFFAAIRKGDSHHSVYLVHSAHQVSLDLRPEERLLPLFWAVDHYKWQQERFPTTPLMPLEGKLPSAEKAAADFHDAMRRFDRDRAERALVALAGSDGPRQALEQLWPYGCRDLSFIGHRAISVSSCWHVLEAIGFHHAEPALRFVVQDLHLRGGGQDRYYKPNLTRTDQLLEKLPPGWAAGRADRAATLELFALLRQGQGDAACELAGKQLAGGLGAQALWDAVHIAAAELLMLHASGSGMAGRPLHASTAVNALRHAFAISSAPRTRLLVLLQAVGWVADFIRVHLPGKLEDAKPIELQGARAAASAKEGVAEIFSQLPPRTYSYGEKAGAGPGHVLVNRAARVELGRKTFALVHQHADAAELYMQAARGWLSVKASVEAHEYKLPAALFEDCPRVSPEWRPRLLAASAHWLHGNQSPDSRVLEAARDAVRKL
jgi:hypothetical protein